ncbi:MULTISPECIES: hypothetical protein [unclassified Microcoleus]|uniref:hypothetical protein n=1 Tax=unclassified Microcoleus TaxID=2642155 RepID=UPI002FD13151
MQLTTDNCCIGFMRSLFHFRRSVIRNKKGRSQLVQRSQCCVFGVKGDRSFILGELSSEKRKGDRTCLKKIIRAIALI